MKEYDLQRGARRIRGGLIMSSIGLMGLIAIALALMSVPIANWDIAKLSTLGMPAAFLLVLLKSGASRIKTGRALRSKALS